MHACYCSEEVLVQCFIILQHFQHKEILINERQCLICQNAQCNHVVVLLATSVLLCNSQRKHSLCQFIIHQDAFFFLLIYILFFSCPLSLTAECHSIPAQTTGPCRPVVRKHSFHPLSDVEQIAHLQLSVKMRRDKREENATKGKRLGCFAL